MLQILKAQKAYYSDSTRQNIEALRPTAHEIYNIRSQVDESPYTHYFQGRVSSYPRVFERRAGWSPQLASILPLAPLTNPAICFQQACNYIPTKMVENGQCVDNPCISTYR